MQNSRQPARKTTGSKRSSGYLRILAVIAILGVGLAAWIYYRHFIAPYESTDDAFVNADVTMIAPQVAGSVVRLAVKDNQEVNQGDLLLEIDPRDYQAKLDLARAGFAAAKGRLQQASTQISVDQGRVGRRERISLPSRPKRNGPSLI